MADTDPTGKTILELDAFVGEVDKPNSFIEVHVVGQAQSQKLAVDKIGGSSTPASNNTKSVSVNLTGDAPVEVLRVPLPIGASWILDIVAAGHINRKPAVLTGNTLSFANVGGSLVKPIDDLIFVALDEFDPLVEGCRLDIVLEDNELVMRAFSENSIPVSPIAFLFTGIRENGDGFAPASGGGGGDIPPDLAKKMQALELAFPSLFFEPYLDERSLEIDIEGTLVFVTIFSEGPYSEYTIDWGNGSTITSNMNYPPLAAGPQGQTGFKSLTQQNDYGSQGTFDVTVSIKTPYGDTSFTTQVTTNPPA